MNFSFFSSFLDDVTRYALLLIRKALNFLPYYLMDYDLCGEQSLQAKGIDPISSPLPSDALAPFLSYLHMDDYRILLIHIHRCVYFFLLSILDSSLVAILREQKGVPSNTQFCKSLSMFFLMQCLHNTFYRIEDKLHLIYVRFCIVRSLFFQEIFYVEDAFSRTLVYIARSNLMTFSALNNTLFRIARILYQIYYRALFVTSNVYMYVLHDIIITDKYTCVKYGLISNG